MRSYDTFDKHGVPVVSHAQNLSRVNLFKKFLGHWAVAVFNDGLHTINKRAFSFFEHNSKATVIDIGTGDSKLFHYFNSKIGAKTLQALDAAANQDEKVQVIIANLENKFPLNDSCYDVVISSQNIEHIIDVPQYCDEISRIIKPDGYAVILTENLSSWINIFALCMGWIPFSSTNMFGAPLGNPLVWHSDLHANEDYELAYSRKLWGVMGHQRVLTLKALKEIFEKRGFIVEEEFSGGYGLFWGFAQSLLSAIDKTHSHFIGIKIRKKQTGNHDL